MLFNVHRVSARQPSLPGKDLTSLHAIYWGILHPPSSALCHSPHTIHTTANSFIHGARRSAVSLRLISHRCLASQSLILSGTKHQHTDTLQSHNPIIYPHSASSTRSSIWTALRGCQTPCALYPCTTKNLKALCRTSVTPGCLQH